MELIKKIRMTIDWLWDPPGIRLQDKFYLFSTKIMFILFSIVGRLFGKERKKRFFANHNIRWFSLFRLLNTEQILVGGEYGVFWCNADNGEADTFSKSHEPYEVAVFQPKKDEIIIDVGSHIGKYAIMSGSKVGITGMVIAIEPDPENYSILKKNIAVNKMEKIVHAINAAVYSNKTTLQFFRDESSTKHSLTKTTDDVISVHAISIDSLIDDLKIKLVDWIKMDAEGAEFDILLGAHESLATNKIKKMLIEIHSSENFNKIIQLLNSTYEHQIIEKLNNEITYVLFTNKYFN